MRDRREVEGGETMVKRWYLFIAYCIESNSLNSLIKHVHEYIYLPIRRSKRPMVIDGGDDSAERIMCSKLSIDVGRAIRNHLQFRGSEKDVYRVSR